MLFNKMVGNAISVPNWIKKNNKATIDNKKMRKILFVQETISINTNYIPNDWQCEFINTNSSINLFTAQKFIPFSNKNQKSNWYL